jgi:heme-degrading monooxygenase HmoA
MSDAPGVTITFAARLKPEAIQGFLQSMPLMVRDTAEFPGFKAIRMLQHRDDPARVLFVERWASEQAHADYIAWRTGRGDMEAVSHMVVEVETQAWPHLVATTERASDSTADGPGVTVTLELRLKPEAAEAFLGAVTMQKAAGFPGFRSIRLVRHKDDPNRVLFVEHWDREADYQAYVDHRLERGEMEGLKRVSASAETNVWPHVIAEL